jgi:integrase/recombinase XerD
LKTSEKIPQLATTLAIKLLVLPSFSLRRYSCRILFTQEVVMLETSPTRAICLAKFLERLKSEGYGSKVVSSYPSCVDRFLDYLERNGLTVYTVQPTEVDRYLKALRMVGKRRGRLARKSLRKVHRAAIHILLRVFHEQWPPVPAALSEAESSCRQCVAGYDAWMIDVHGLAANTRCYRRAEAHLFLTWWAQRSSGNPLSQISVSDIDVFVQWRSSCVCRASLAVVAGSLRSVFRYLHETGRAPVDLSAAIHSPRVYALDGIPSALRAEDLTKMLGSAQAKRSPVGRRDYAILTLLATYGLRAGELVALRLEDIDWRKEFIRVRHAKTKTLSELPLLRKPAEAILAYLRHGRPQTERREVFLRSLAPFQPLGGPSPLYKIIARNLVDAQSIPPGKRGSHALRHARAASLLRGGVPLKTIGDVLGHRSPRSTMVYLKLATRELRAVALDLPVGAAS